MTMPVGAPLINADANLSSSQTLTGWASDLDVTVEVNFSSAIYCYSDSCTVTATVNGGGIAGISYASITNCYSTSSPTALDAVGGIVGKDLESGVIRYCWCTKSVVSGEQDEGKCTEEHHECRRCRKRRLYRRRI